MRNCNKKLCGNGKKTFTYDMQPKKSDKKEEINESVEMGQVKRTRQYKWVRYLMKKVH